MFSAPKQKALVSEDALKTLDKAEKIFDMIQNSIKPGAESSKKESDSAVIKISASAAAKGEANPSTGAPAMNIAPAIFVLAAAACVLKK